MFGVASQAPTGREIASRVGTAPARLAATSESLASACSVDEVMQIITHAARLMVDCDGATLVLRDGDLCHYAEEDAISALWKGSRFPMSACISGWCMLKGEPAVIPDIYADDRIPHDAYRPTFVKSLAMVPIGAPDAIAAMGAYWASSFHPTVPEVALIQALADAAEPALRAVR